MLYELLVREKVKKIPLILDNKIPLYFRDSNRMFNVVSNIPRIHNIESNTCETEMNETVRQTFPNES